MRLVVDGFGKFLGRKGETLVIKEEGKMIQRIQPRELEQVLISGKGCVSTDALELLAEHGVDVLITDFRGEVKARLSSPEMRTVNTRRQQYQAYQNGRGSEIAKAIVKAKIRNQASLLGTLSKKRRDTDPELASLLHRASEEMKRMAAEVECLEDLPIDAAREILTNLEGRAAGAYWQVLGKVFGEDWDFSGRSGRYATDPVNAMLNYGYGVLLGEVWRAVHYAGLDPYGGFLHADRPGKPSMALDLMEEFRAQVVDKSVIKFVTKKMVSPVDFKMVDGVCQMNDGTRKPFLRELLQKLESEVRVGELKLTWAGLILHQARKLAKFLRGEVSSYEGFWQRW